MNVSAVSTVASYSSSSSVSNKPQMSDEQKDLVSSVLEGYDSSSLNAEDASEIVAAFQDAGIAPSRELANTIRESGFSASEIGELAGVAGAGRTPPPPPPGGTPPSSSEDLSEIEAIASALEILLNIGNQSSESNSISDEEEEFIASLLSEYDSSNISSEDAIEITSALKDAGIAPSRELASVMEESGFNAREIGDLAQVGRTPQASSFESIVDYTSRIMSLTEDMKQEVKDLFDSYNPENTNLTADEASKVVVNSLSQILADSNNYKSTSYYG